MAKPRDIAGERRRRRRSASKGRQMSKGYFDLSGVFTIELKKCTKEHEIFDRLPEPLTFSVGSQYAVRRCIKTKVLVLLHTDKENVIIS